MVHPLPESGSTNQSEQNEEHKGNHDGGHDEEGVTLLTPVASMVGTSSQLGVEVETQELPQLVKVDLLVIDVVLVDSDNREVHLRLESSKLGLLLEQ